MAPQLSIVVDDCSTDSTTTVASQSPVRLIEFDTHRGVAAAQNAGALAARAPLLTFIDADVVPIGDLFAREFSLHRCGLQSDPVDSACTRDQKPAQRPEPQLAPAVSSFSGCRPARSFAVHAVLASDVGASPNPIAPRDRSELAAVPGCFTRGLVWGSQCRVSRCKQLYYLYSLCGLAAGLLYCAGRATRARRCHGREER